MKKTLFLLISIFLLNASSLFAYDFSSVNSNGDTIYYNITSAVSPFTVSVTNKVYNTYSGNIIIPSTVINNSITYSVNAIENYAFEACSGLTSVTFPNSLVSIGDEAFAFCSALTSVNFPSSLRTIGILAFSHSGLTSVTIPDSVTSISMYGFSSCTNLTEIHFNAINCYTDSPFGFCDNVKLIYFGTNVSTISSNIFDQFSNFMSLTIRSFAPIAPTSNVNFYNIPVYIPCGSLASYQANSNWNQSNLLQVCDTISLNFVSQTLDDDIYCDGVISVELNVRNVGFDTITSMTISNTINGNVQNYNWTGSIITPQLRAIIIPNLPITMGIDNIVNTTITQINGQPQTGLSRIGTIEQEQIQSLEGDLKLILTRDKYGDETSWTFRNSVGDTIISGGNYPRLTEIGTVTDTIIFPSLVTDCYKFEILDRAGDGINANYGAGNYRIENEFGDTLIYSNGQYGYGEKKNINYSNCHDTIIYLVGSICAGDTFYFNQQLLTTSGIFIDSLQGINGCDSILHLTLTVNQLTTPSNISLIGVQNYFELSWQGNADNYIIYRDNDSIASINDTIFKDSTVVNGVNYCYKVKALNSECVIESEEICQVFLGLTEIIIPNNITIYPNPTNNRTTLQVEGLTEKADIIIYDINGRGLKKYTMNANQNDLEIDVSGFAKGIYQIKLTTQSYSISKKLIIQ